MCFLFAPLADMYDTKTFVLHLRFTGSSYQNDQTCQWAAFLKVNDVQPVHRTAIVSVGKIDFEI